jgi:hypothetical protein
MSLIKVDRNKQLRDFGLVFALAGAILAAVLLWKQRPTWVYCVGFSAVFLLLGLFAPKVLEPLEKLWMKFGLFMSNIMTKIVVGILFYAVVTPLGLLMRVLGKRPLKLYPDPSATTYWIPVEKDGPGTRHYSPF